MNDVALAWAVFFASATFLTMYPRFLADKRLKEISYLFSLLLWVAALYTWIVGFSDIGLWGIAWLHLVPVLLVSGLLFVELGESMSKRSKYG